MGLAALLVAGSVAADQIHKTPGARPAVGIPAPPGDGQTLAPSRLPILLVDDDGSIGGSYDDVAAAYATAMDNGGYSGQYDTHEVAYNDNGPDAASMASYDVVIWLTGETWNSSYCVSLSTTDETNLATYLDGGGSLILVGQDYLYDRYPSAGPFNPGEFPYDYLDLTSVVQDYWSVPYYHPDAHAFGMSGSPAAGTDFALLTPFGTTDLFIDWLTYNGDGMFEIDGDNDGTAEGPASNYYMTRTSNVMFSTLELGGLVDGSSPNTFAEVMGSILDDFLGGGGAVDTLFEDDFEDGAGNWAGDWGLDSTYANSGTYSYTDSPYGLPPNLSTITGRMDTGVDLTAYLGATLTFQYIHWIEQGFDYGYLDVSGDGGGTWIQMKTYNDTVDTWTEEVVDLGAFVGNDDVRVRFRLVTDPAYVEDGWYVDDVMITATTEDLTPPLILHDPPDDTLSITEDLVAMAEIVDISGLNYDSLFYRFDGGTWTGITHDSTGTRDYYYYTIPEAAAGTWVEYYLIAEDASPNSNYAESDTFMYIAGTVLFNDDGDAEFIATWGPNDEMAVLFDPIPDATITVVTLQYLFYRDTSYPLDSVEVHVWDIDAGLPGEDVITPYNIWPANTPEEPHAWTYIDVRPLSIQMPEGEGFCVGNRMLSALPVNSVDSPGTFFHSYLAPGGSAWVDAGVDYFYRAVAQIDYAVQENTGVDERTFALMQNRPNPVKGATTIRFELPQRTETSLKVYDVNGRLVRTLFDEVKDAGAFTVQWNGMDGLGRTLPAGVYFYRLSAGEQVATRKLILTR
jgi:hypothetical protein